MKILVVNAGSSSIKYQVFDMIEKVVLCSGIVEKIGTDGGGGTITHKKDGEKIVIELDMETHAEGMQEVEKILLDEKWGAVKDVSEIKGAGHRIVHGGTMSEPEIITPEVLEELKDAIPLAPLHNPVGILGIEIAQKVFPQAVHVAVLDTAFHQTMSPAAYMYPLPYEYYEELGLRKYGFHGTSHKYVTDRLAEILGKKVEDVNAITVHLGNGSSITAVRNGKSVDTSMGFTPLDGLMMGTRCGSIDPAIVGFLAKNKNMTIEQIDSIMTKKSGFQGIAGNNDLRNVEARAEAGEERAILSLDMLIHRVKHFIGAYLANLGVWPDAIVFTAGVGENSDYVRGGVLQGLEHLGIKMDVAKNKEKYGEYIDLGEKGSKIRLFAIRTNEELEIARQTFSLIQGE